MKRRCADLRSLSDGSLSMAEFGQQQQQLSNTAESQMQVPEPPLLLPKLASTTTSADCITISNS